MGGADTGHITTLKVFNFELETMATHVLQVELATSNYSDTKFLRVLIQNVNEPPKCEDPKFVAGTASVDVADNIDKGTSIYHIHAEDEDNGDILKKCRLAIQVEDQHNLFCQGTLVVNVRDMNDEPPVFKKDLKDTVHVLESEPVGKIIAKVEALDRDENDTVIYRFAKPEDIFALGESKECCAFCSNVTWFALDSGDITLVKPLDYDNTDLRKVYLLPILAFDNDLKHTATQTLTFAVLNDQNEAAKYFQLDTNSGIISRTDQPLDYDNGVKQQYSLSISVTEVGKVPSKSCTGTITINIQNTNDESPIYINAPAVINVNDNQAAGTVIAKFTATDRDLDDQVFYEFASNHKGFTLDEETGVLKLAYPADYEDIKFPHTQILEIRVYDTGRVHSVTTAVTINIIDINDNAPQCRPTLYNVVLAETNPPGSIVASLDCWDDDLTTPNNLLTYTMALDTFSKDRFVNQKNEILVSMQS
ncbi:hypothetical protein scyTo_0002068 [Scyliorhinus torazame]|uniref:Cadherin domain-containing protein n=1 Tax=Scyliorhinus torazame TaxID=75743 RepID=A0A401PHF7_SCYTO|nr:hypothetical protein [Scyliorhinus torazame]